MAIAPSTPVVIKRKKRPATVPPSPQFLPPQAEPQPPKGAPMATGKRGKSEAAEKPEQAPSVTAAPVSATNAQPQQTSAPSGYTKRQRRTYARRQRLLQVPEFAQISAAMVTRWPHLFRVTPDTMRPLAIGIATDLCAQLPDFDPKLVHLTLNQWI